MTRQIQQTATHQLPYPGDQLFLTDGGLETTLIFLEGLELPFFAACDLLMSDAGRQHLLAYYRSYASLAQSRQLGFILESATWRANPDWCQALGYDEATFHAVNRDAVKVCAQVRDEFASPASPMLISGCIGPRRDGYKPDQQMSVVEAQQYHHAQIQILKESGVDMVSAFTMNYINEAVGVALAGKALGIPVVISYTVETDGCLATGDSLREAIEAVDAATDSSVAYYMINCAHPDHFQHALESGEAWVQRIGGIRANASCKSHAELDEATELDSGNPVELAEQYRDLLRFVPNVKVLGGCCGTDHRHVEEISRSCAGHFKLQKNNSRKALRASA